MSTLQCDITAKCYLFAVTWVIFQLTELIFTLIYYQEAVGGHKRCFVTAKEK